MVPAFCCLSQSMRYVAGKVADERVTILKPYAGTLNVEPTLIDFALSERLSIMIVVPFLYVTLFGVT